MLELLTVVTLIMLENLYVFLFILITKRILFIKGKMVTTDAIQYVNANSYLREKNIVLLLPR